MNQVTIQNVNGVTALTIPIAPGVVVLRGHNGAGKTMAREAVRAALKDRSATARPSDGVPAGRVTTPGSALLICDRNRFDGLPEVALVSTSALARFIDPGFKDQAARDRARIEALLEMVDLPADAEAIEALCGGQADLHERMKRVSHRDLLRAADTVRAEAQAMARKAEEGEEREKAVRDYASWSAAESNGPDCDEDPGKARSRLLELEAQAERARIQAQARADQQRRQESIRRTLAERPDLEAAGRGYDEANLAVEFATEELAKARTKLEMAQATLRVAAKAREQCREDLRRWEEQKALLDQPLAGPTETDVTAIEQQIEVARTRLSVAERAALRAEAETARQKADELAEEFRRAGQQLRTVAANVAKVTGELLAKRSADLGGLTVVEGRLAVDVDGKLQDFESRLSFGQRVHLALVVCLQGRQNRWRAILDLDPNFWNALDPDRRAEVHAIAQQHSVCLLTEEPTEGELRVERLETEEVSL